MTYRVVDTSNIKNICFKSMACRDFTCAQHFMVFEIQVRFLDINRNYFLFVIIIFDFDR
ncbi:hypothetical protein VCHA39O220_40125 [Vibrio chagasii]|nr:hypothetical protein VCHA39O220_40125 [Vibrio chagasii]